VSLRLQPFGNFTPGLSAELLFVVVQSNGVAAPLSSFSHVFEGNTELTVTPTYFHYFNDMVLDTVTLSNGQQFAIVEDANFSTNSYTGGNDLALIAVPEPSTGVSLLAGLGSLLGLQRFRRRRA
jgi:hypothetical protein